MKFPYDSLSRGLKALQLVWYALKVGVIGGLGAVAYITLFNIIYNIVFLGRLKFTYNESLYSPVSRWGMGVILIPIIGGLIVVWLLKNFGNNEKGVREPDIIHFVHPEEGKQRYSIELVKSLASVMTIGTGGSVGWEIPIAQLGATLSYLFARLQAIPAQQRLVLIAAGAAATLAAVFNAPLTGIIFALEILLFAFTLSHVVLIAISAITSIFIWKLIYGSKTLFHIKMVTPTNIELYFKQLILYIPLGILIGITAVVLIGGIHWFKGLFERNIRNVYLRHSIGVGLVGIMLYLLVTFFGHYYIVAMGFATIQNIMDHMLESPWLLLLIFSSKILALCLTLGSGAVGGLFAPSLFLGATLGGIYGIVLQQYFPSMQIDIFYFVIAGMGGMLSSVTGAMLTAFIFILEISKNYYLILPLFISAIIGTFMRISFYPKGIYTFKMFQHGLMFNYRKL